MIPNAWQSFDFGLGEDIDMLRDTTRNFSDDKIAPREALDRLVAEARPPARAAVA